MNEFPAFAPGEDINRLDISRPSNLALSEITVKFPGRIHITPIDCNRFDFGKPGGGGIGFAVDLPNTLTIQRSNELSFKTNVDKHTPMLMHYYYLMQTLVSSTDKLTFDLNVADMMKQHCGLGSSVSVACAIMYTLNEMYGAPLSVSEIRELIVTCPPKSVPPGVSRWSKLSFGGGSTHEGETLHGRADRGDSSGG